MLCKCENLFSIGMPLINLEIDHDTINIVVHKSSNACKCVCHLPFWAIALAYGYHDSLFLSYGIIKLFSFVRYYLLSDTSRHNIFYKNINYVPHHAVVRVIIKNSILWYTLIFCPIIITSIIKLLSPPPTCMHLLLFKWDGGGGTKYKSQK